MIGQRPQPTPAIIKVKASSELRDEEFNNILAFIKVAVGSQGKCRLLIVVGVFHGWMANLVRLRGWRNRGAKSIT